MTRSKWWGHPGREGSIRSRDREEASRTSRAATSTRAPETAPGGGRFSAHLAPEWIIIGIIQQYQGILAEGVGLTSNLLHFGAIITAFPDTRNLLTCIEFQ